jgi:hypothetical protein
MPAVRFFLLMGFEPGFLCPGFSAGRLPFFFLNGRLQTTLRRSGGVAPSGVATGQVATVGASTTFHG